MSDDARHVIVEDEALAAGFTQIPNLVLRRPDLSPGAKLTYMVLLSYAWQSDSCYPGQDRLAVDMGVSERSVITYLKQLAESGLVTIRRRGLGMTNVYVLHRLNAGSENSALPDVQVPALPEVQDLPTNNTQTKKTQTEESFENSNGRSPRFDANDRIREALLPFAEDFGREFSDQAPLTSTLSRLANLYQRSGCELNDYIELVYRARRITKERSAAIRGTAETAGGKAKMGYFFAILEDQLGGRATTESAEGRPP
jgi:hypothetical protein